MATTTQPNRVSIDQRTRIGEVSLTVADLDRSIQFYTGPLGFTVIEKSDSGATLGVGSTPLLFLTELAGAAPWPGYATGLYHFAILLPERVDLGRWLKNWLAHGNRLPGQGDHLVSEALYLSDPDGNGIEVYRDRPRSEWTWQGDQVVMDSLPVDISGLLDLADAESGPYTGFPEGTTVGHVHLQVSDIPKAKTFYVDVLGFDLVAEMPSALFVSAGGYHHHLGMNVWHSRGMGAAKPGHAGLRHYTIVLADDSARQAVLERVSNAGGSIEWEGADAIIQDPWGTTARLRIG